MKTYAPAPTFNLLSCYVCVLQLHQIVHTASRQLLPKIIIVLGGIVENVCLSFWKNSFQDLSVTYGLF